MDTGTNKRPYTDLSQLTPEQLIERERERQRIAYRKRHPKVRKPKRSIEERREWYRENYRKKMNEKGLVPFKDRPKMTKEEKAERKRKWYAAKREKEGNPIKPRKPKAILTREEKLAKYREANARRKAKKAPKPVPMPKVKPLRKPKPPREPKTKPEVLPTLVRDESDYVSVRIDAKTVIRVPPGKDIEQVRQRFIAKMLQNSRI